MASVLEKCPKIWPVVRDVVELEWHFLPNVTVVTPTLVIELGESITFMMPGDTEAHRHTCTHNTHTLCNCLTRHSLTCSVADYFITIHQLICWVLRDSLTIGPLPQPCAVQACSLRTWRLHGESPSITKNLWEELELKMRTPSSQRP